MKYMNHGATNIVKEAKPSATSQSVSSPVRANTTKTRPGRIIKAARRL
jgi:hypothetical protein